jgi:hypothetical protein
MIVGLSAYNYQEVVSYEEKPLRYMRNKTGSNWGAWQKIYSEATPPIKKFTANIPTSGWSSTAPYYVDVTVTGILEADTPAITPTYSGTLTTDQAIKTAWNKIDRIVTSANKIRAYAFEEKPTTAIPIQLTITR